jgi:site-specific DNA recombinase
MYMEIQGLVPMLRELERLGWHNKLWITRKGRERGGRPFMKSSLQKLLTNVTYIGQLRYRDEIHQGEHEGIVDGETFRAVGRLLHRNRHTGGPLNRNRYGALLRGILRCAPCDAAMTHAYTAKPHGARYRYYVCGQAQKRGWHICPSKSVPAGEIESFVVDQIQRIGRDPGLLQATLSAAVAQQEADLKSLAAERKPLAAELARLKKDAATASAESANGSASAVVGRLRQLHERLQQVEDRLGAIDDEVSLLEREPVDESEAAAALAEFDGLWESLEPRERVRLIQLLVARVDFDGARGTVAVTFHPTGLKSLAEESASRTTP